MADRHYIRGDKAAEALKVLARLGREYYPQLGIEQRIKYNWEQRQLLFRDHGLIIQPYSDSFVSEIYLLYKDGREDLKVYQACSGGYAIPGPHWDYIETVFTPWVNEKIEAICETNRQAQLKREREIAARLRTNIADWAQSRVIPSKPAQPIGLDDLLDDDRLTLQGK